MRIAMVNSRDYQFAFENVYLSALSLTLARFQFMIQGYSNWGAFYSPLTAGSIISTSPTSDIGTDHRRRRARLPQPTAAQEDGPARRPRPRPRPSRRT